MRLGWFLISAATITLMGAPLYSQSIIVNAGAREWIDAARIGRSDMLVLGDSVVWAGGNGWDAGMIHSFANHIGLAGTGLTPDSYFTAEGEGYQAYGDWNLGLTIDTNAVPQGQRNFVWRGAVTANGSEPSFGFGWGIFGGTLDPNAAYDWHLWTAPLPGGGTLGAHRRIYIEGGPIPTIQTIPAIGLDVAPAGQLNKVVLHFDAVTSPIPGLDEMQIENTSNTSIIYSRLLQPNARGATVSSWGYGAASTLRFYQDLYLGGLMDSTGRQGLLSNLVDSGSGKLNVMIAEGFNDQNESLPSVHGISPGNSAAAFHDNISSLMDAVRSDWSAGGHSLSDLSFTLLGMYESGYANEPLRLFADELRQIALSDPQTAFIDLYQIAPSYAQSVANGYIPAFDGVHPTYSGSLAFGDAAVTALLRGVAPALPGDVNLDSKVDGADLLWLVKSWGQVGSFLGADFNHDGNVNASDLGILASNWQAGVATPDPGLLTSVPEPSALGAILIACLAWVPRRRALGGA